MSAISTRDNTPADIHVFEFDPEIHQLNRYLHADRAETSGHKQWLYKDLIIKDYQRGDCRYPA